MQRGSFIQVFLYAGIMLAAACKKDEEAAPAFVPAGYWKGYVYLYNSALLNRDNGTGRLYFGLQGPDSVGPLAIMDGRYTEVDGVYTGKFGKGADSVILESITTSDRVIYGITTIVTAVQRVSTEFQIIKQK